MDLDTPEMNAFFEALPRPLGEYHWAFPYDFFDKYGEQLARLVLQGAVYREIYEKLDGRISTQKMLYSHIRRYVVRIKRERRHNVTRIARIRPTQEADDYDYITDPRTVRREMHALLIGREVFLPALKELEEMKYGSNNNRHGDVLHLQRSWVQDADHRGVRP